jgi:5-methylcytosine-specific restriction protein A
VQRCKSCVPLDDLVEDLKPTDDPALYEQRLSNLMQHDVPERPAGNPTPEQRSGESSRRFVRDLWVAWWVLRRADGRCELCALEAPFNRLDGTPFLEVHHVTRLADRGPDTPENAAGVCPNCHRRLHHGSDATECGERLRATIHSKDPPSGAA